MSMAVSAMCRDGPSTALARGRAIGARLRTGVCAAIAASMAAASSADDAQSASSTPTTLPTINVVGVAPLPGIGVARDALPYTVQTGNGGDLRDGENGSLAEYLLRGLTGTNASDIQGSPFQRDLAYRGYTASSLIGSPQGVSVFLDGVRFNAPFGDVVNWDLVPEAAIAKVMLVPGSNPIYGLNTLGGALVLTTQSGLSAPGFNAGIRAGSFGRRRADLAYGVNDGNGLHAFVAGTYFDEEGWRDHSAGHLGNVFAKVGRVTARDEIEATLLHGTSMLAGNGLVPDIDYTDVAPRPGLAQGDRAAVYTWPDQTRNSIWQGTLRGRHEWSGDAALDALAFVRYAKRRTVSGDTSQAYEDYVDACGAGFNTDGSPIGAGCPVDRAQGAAIPPGVLNTTQTSEHSWGLALDYAQAWRGHRVAVGADYNESRVGYSQDGQAATVGDERGVVAMAAAPIAFVSGVEGTTHAFGIFATDTWAVLPRTFVTASLRWNASRVASTLATAEDGTQPRTSFDYRKLNPALGIAQQLDRGLTLFANASQSNRVPTVIELGCADPDAPCRLPAGLQSDPMLQQVVARTLEGGARWRPGADTSASISLYRTDNRDDILFLRAANTQQGYFANFPKTRHQGIDAALDQTLGAVAINLRYSYLDATYEADGELASGERTIAVHPGMRIAGLPRNTLKLTTTWQVTPTASIAMDVVAVSSVGTVGNEDGRIDDAGETDPVDARVAGHAVVNVRGTWAIDRHLTVSGGVTNLFDTRYGSFGALATDLFPGGQLVAPQVAPGEAPVARFVAPGAPRAWYLSLGLRY
jgi:outer membrane receptor protein involved in Fe transport